MLSSYHDSISSGTATNRLTQAKSYVAFAVAYQFQPLRPSSTDLCMYTQYLINSGYVPTTVKNYLSGAKTWLSEHGGEIFPFTSFEYLQMYNGISKRSTHIPMRAAPLTWAHIRLIVDFLDLYPHTPRAAKPCILIGFFTFLRSSNLLSPTMSAWGGPHTILAQDIMVAEEGLHISVRTTKTKAGGLPVTTTIPWQDDHHYCPASAWMEYAARTQPWILGPAFLTDQHLPLTARHLVGLMRLALKNCDDLDPARVSLHSLRRGATQCAVSAGLSMDQIKEKGMWRSDSGISPYLK